MDYKHLFYPESTFGGFTDIDGTLSFYIRVNALVEPHFVVLDVGCGRGAYGEDPVVIRKNLRIIRGKAKKVIGIDVNKAAEENPFIDTFYLLHGYQWPLDDNSVDLIICDHVLEHVENPDKFFSEIQRILKHGGYICIRTPNSWGYVALLARMIPNRHHFKVLQKVQDNRKEEDVFPTCYRCNSIPKLRAMLDKYNIEHVVYGYAAEPSYLSFSRLAYGLGVFHQRFAPNFLKLVIFAFGRANKSGA